MHETVLIFLWYAHGRTWLPFWYYFSVCFHRIQFYHIYCNDVKNLSDWDIKTTSKRQNHIGKLLQNDVDILLIGNTLKQRPSTSKQHRFFVQRNYIEKYVEMTWNFWSSTYECNVETKSTLYQRFQWIHFNASIISVE